MPPQMQDEKTPGVYVRAENQEPQELDMLWSNSKHYQREERSPLMSFLAGLVVGTILTTAVFLLFMHQPEIKTGNDLATPVLEDGGLESANTDNAAPKPSEPGPASSPGDLTPANTQTYTVRSGDTLGGIAGKFYGSTAPKYVEKIQRANNLRSADSLQLNQKLVIPPKSYI